MSFDQYNQIKQLFIVRQLFKYKESRLGVLCMHIGTHMNVY